jgi:hypothetical protein
MTPTEPKSRVCRRPSSTSAPSRVLSESTAAITSEPRTSGGRPCAFAHVAATSRSKAARKSGVTVDASTKRTPPTSDLWRMSGETIFTTTRPVKLAGSAAPLRSHACAGTGTPAADSTSYSSCSSKTARPSASTARESVVSRSRTVVTLWLLRSFKTQTPSSQVSG